eukprot:TRINITY_DN7154_c0_g1_i13.p1 TRINITY_DN7154_c0_g1~~TRINITY_DN7154_c0_g1_i13.p1  ORF type:complete len:177 (-),score=22.85 TRINITY_DN7154_c0_g1_i13:370-900(-)
MEFPFDCEALLDSDAQGYSVLDSSSLRKALKKGGVAEVIDTFGALSAKSQGLKAVITTAGKTLESDHRIYIKAEKNKLIGFIKVGRKNLFIRNMEGEIFEISPLCVLDFYTYEKIQRSGFGKVRSKVMCRRYLRRCLMRRRCDRRSWATIDLPKNCYTSSRNTMTCRDMCRRTTTL